MQGANTEMKVNVTIVGDSTTRRKKFTARQWAALIEFFDVEIRKQVQKHLEGQIKKSLDEREVRNIVVAAIKEQHVDANRQYIRVWLGDNFTEDIWKFRFNYGQMANMAKTERGISIMVFIHWIAQEIWDMEEDDPEKQRINHITP